MAIFLEQFYMFYIGLLLSPCGWVTHKIGLGF